MSLKVQFSGVKRSGLFTVFGRFQSSSPVSVFLGLFDANVVVNDGNKKCNRQLGFEIPSSLVTERHN